MSRHFARGCSQVAPRHSAVRSACRVAPAFSVLASRHSLAARCYVKAFRPTFRCSSSIGSGEDSVGTRNSSDLPTTDATFRYRNFQWETSRGERHDFEYIIAQQPSGGETARNALLALEERLPRPPSGWSVVLMPSVSIVCSGKEEMRPLATLLSQRGHRCYILEWPGWSVDPQMNYALAHCKTESLADEYADFWSQLLEHIARSEAAECASIRAAAEAANADGVVKQAPHPRLCVLGAGLAAPYAVRALRALQRWAADARDNADVAAVTQTAAEAEALMEQITIASCVGRYESLVLVGPAWDTDRRGKLLSCISAQKASSLLGSWLHSESRLGKYFQRWYFSPRRFLKHFVHLGQPDTERLVLAATFLFRRKRPYEKTDGVVLSGLLDPSGGISVDSFAAELEDVASALPGGALLLSPSAREGDTIPMSPLVTALDSRRTTAATAVTCSTLPSTSPLPHEMKPSAAVWALDAWLAGAKSPTAAP